MTWKRSNLLVVVVFVTTIAAFTFTLLSSFVPIVAQVTSIKLSSFSSPSAFSIFIGNDDLKVNDSDSENETSISDDHLRTLGNKISRLSSKSSSLSFNSSHVDNNRTAQDDSSQTSQQTKYLPTDVSGTSSNSINESTNSNDSPMSSNHETLPVNDTSSSSSSSSSISSFPTSKSGSSKSMASKEGTISTSESPVIFNPILIPPITIQKDPHDSEIKRLISYSRNPPAKAPMVMFRAIGNDLPPRHAIGQTLSNVRFILENEPDYEKLDKRWYINRVVDSSSLLEILKLLVSYNATFSINMFNASDFHHSIDYNLRSSAHPDVLRSHVFKDPNYPPFQRLRRWDYIFDDGNQFVIRNNAARNDMLDLALSSGAQYALPWDGNCFLNERAFSNLSTSLLTSLARSKNDTSKATKYFYVPMSRMIDNQVLLDSNFMPENLDEEPQLIFHSSAKERFDEEKPYGRRPKVDLLHRLRIPGPWEKFIGMSKMEKSDDIDDENVVAPASWVARLSSGMPHLEQPGTSVARGASRSDGVEVIIAKSRQLVAENLFNYSTNMTTLIYDRQTIQQIAKSEGGSDDIDYEFIQRLTRIVVEEEKVVDEDLQFENVVWNSMKNIFKLLFFNQSDDVRHAVMTSLENMLEFNASYLAANPVMSAIPVCTMLDGFRLASLANVSTANISTSVQDNKSVANSRAETWAREYADALEINERMVVTDMEDTNNIPPYYRHGLDGIGFELGAACAHAYTGEFYMLMRRTALARGRMYDMLNHTDGVDRAKEVGMWMMLAGIGRKVGVDIWGYQGHIEKEESEKAQTGSLAQAVEKVLQKDEHSEWKLWVQRVNSCRMTEQVGHETIEKDTDGFVRYDTNSDTPEREFHGRRESLPPLWSLIEVKCRWMG